MLLRKKEEIEAWLNQYQIKNYELIPNKEYCYVVNVMHCVDLNKKKLKNIEVEFNEVYGFFDCSFNELMSLEGSPEVVGGSFFCNYNQLISLEKMPKIVEYALDCNNNKLITLNGCPQKEMKVRTWNFENNNLTIEGLKYLPELKSNILLNFNEELGELQKISNCIELKEVLNIKKETENLLNIIEKEEFYKKNLNKI